MNRISKIVALCALAATTVLALGAGTANAGTVSTASDCKPVAAHTEYKWVPNVTNAGPTQWTTDNAPANTQRTFLWKGQQVAYHRDGTKSQFIDSVTCAVSAPLFNIDRNTCSVTVPFTPGIDTFLYGVNGHTETPITHDVTVTGSLDGAPDTAPQFWIGYTAQPGYVITNPGAAPTHIDFYNGDYVLDCGATGDVTWDYQGLVTGTVSFNADATGGSLDYHEQQRQVAPRRRHLVQADRRPHGRLRRHDHRRQPRLHRLTTPAPTTSSPRLSTAARPAATAIRSRCLRTEGRHRLPGGDYDMSQGAGIVTGGNLVVN